MANTINITDAIDIFNNSSSADKSKLFSELIGKKKLLTENFNDEQFTILIQLLLKIVDVDDKNFMKLGRKTLKFLLQKYPSKIKFFQLILNFRRDDKWKALSLIRDFDFHALSALFKDEAAVDYLNDLFSEQNILKISSKSNHNSSERDEDVEKSLIITSLQLLEKLYKYTSRNHNCDLQKFHLIVFKKIIPLAHHHRRNICSTTLELLMATVKTNFQRYIFEKHENEWNDYKKKLEKYYCNSMNYNIKKGNLDWSVQWCFHVQLFGIELFKDNDIMMILFNVIKHAFLCSHKVTKKVAYESWIQMIDICSSDPAVLTLQIDFLMKPFVVSFSIRTRSVFIEAIKSWWHLIVTLYPANENDLIKVVPKFLEFSFELNDHNKQNINENYSEVKNLTTDVLLQILVSEETCSEVMTNAHLDERLPEPISYEIILKMIQIIINCIKKATTLIIKFNAESNNKSDIEDLNKKCQVLWSSLINIMRRKAENEFHFDLLLSIEKIIMLDHDKRHLTLINTFSSIILDGITNLDDLATVTDDTVIMFIEEILKIVIYKQDNLKVHNIIIELISNMIKKKKGPQFYSLMIDFILMIFNKLVPVIDDNKSNIDYSFINELWCLLAGRFNKYLVDVISINVQNLFAERNLNLLIKFLLIPLVYHNPNNNSDQLVKIFKNWKDLYNELENQLLKYKANKPNLILDLLTANITDTKLLNHQLSNVMLINIANIMMGNFNYKYQLSKNEMPNIIKIINYISNEMTVHSNANNYEVEIIILIKLLYPFVNTTFLRDKVKAIAYLTLLKSTIKGIFQLNVDKKLLENEILSLWRLIYRVILFAEGETLTPEIDHFLILYHDIDKFMQNHPNEQIKSGVLKNKTKVVKVAAEVPMAVVDLSKSDDSFAIHCSFNPTMPSAGAVEQGKLINEKSIKKENVRKRSLYENDDDYTPYKKRAATKINSTYVEYNSDDSFENYNVAGVKETRRRRSSESKNDKKIPLVVMKTVDNINQARTPTAEPVAEVNNNNQVIVDVKKKPPEVSKLMKELNNVTNNFSKIKRLLKDLETKSDDPIEALKNFMQNPEQRPMMINTISELLTFQEAADVMDKVIKRNKKDID